MYFICLQVQRAELSLVVIQAYLAHRDDAWAARAGEELEFVLRACARGPGQPFVLSAQAPCFPRC